MTPSSTVWHAGAMFRHAIFASILFAVPLRAPASVRASRTVAGRALARDHRRRDRRLALRRARGVPTSLLAGGRARRHCGLRISARVEQAILRGVIVPSIGLPVEGYTTLDMPVERMWNIQLDVGRWRDWNTCFACSAMIGGGPLELGGTLVFVFNPIQRRYWYKMPAVAKIVELVPCQRVTWEVKLPGFHALMSALVPNWRELERQSRHTIERSGRRDQRAEAWPCD